MMIMKKSAKQEMMINPRKSLMNTIMMMRSLRIMLMISKKMKKRRRLSVRMMRRSLWRQC
jgi:hypothetical protein